MRKKLVLAILLLFASAKPTFAAFATLDQLNTAFASVIGIVAILAGFASLIMIAVGAFRYMLGQGDPKALGQARATIFWAVAGLVFIVASYLVISFLIGFLNVPGIGKFCIPKNPGDCGI